MSQGSREAALLHNPIFPEQLSLLKEIMEVPIRTFFTYLQPFTYLRFGVQKGTRNAYSWAEKHSIRKKKTGLPNELIHQQITRLNGCHESLVLLRHFGVHVFLSKKYLLSCQVSSVYQSKENIYFWQTCKNILGFENLAEISLIHITYILPFSLFCFCLDTE